MPFYDLKCRRCDFVFNVMATMEEKERKSIPCPGCGSTDLERSYERSNISVISRGAESRENCARCENAGGCPGARIDR